jgi:phosphoserine phosphatase
MTPTEISPGLVVNVSTPDLKLSDFKLIAFDMDSTLINIECVDEIADAAGRKAEVAAITEAAMRGEITDYKESLRQRVALLKGVSVASMDEVYHQRLKLNPGAAELVHACKEAGMKVLLVSGGFTFFTDRVRDELGIDYTRSNVLEVKDGFLTGKMVDQPWGDICDGDEKRKMLLETCANLGINPLAGDRHGRRRQRLADDGRGRPLGGLPRQAARARAGHGRHQRRRADRLLELFN